MNTRALNASPFHAGEKALQIQTGKRERMEVFGRKVIRDHMPDQHREFYAQLPFLVAGSVDPEGNPWATLLTGRPGFVRSPDDRTLQITADPRSGDPAVNAMIRDAALGLLGIELSTRRRNRLNGRIQALGSNGITLQVDQAFGNCPQYIQSRSIDWVAGNFSNPAVERFTHLPQDAASLVAQADTFFVSSFVPAENNPIIEGVDVSHRGGRPGFVRVTGNTLTIPDFRGNHHFNTLGNFVLNPKAGLVFADFTNGDLLQLTGDVTLMDAQHADVTSFTAAERAWQVDVARGQWLRRALPFRFGKVDYSPRNAQTGTWVHANTVTPNTTQGDEP